MPDVKIKEEEKEEKVPATRVGILARALQVGITSVCKRNLKKDEVVVLATFIDNQFVIWVYPPSVDLKIAQNLLVTAVTQVKHTFLAREAIREKNNSKKIRDQYMM